jgi:hypothetical protein
MNIANTPQKAPVQHSRGGARSEKVVSGDLPFCSKIRFQPGIHPRPFERGWVSRRCRRTGGRTIKQPRGAADIVRQAALEKMAAVPKTTKNPTAPHPPKRAQHGVVKRGERRASTRNQTLDRGFRIVVISGSLVYILWAIYLGVASSENRSFETGWLRLGNWGQAAEDAAPWFLPAMLAATFAAYGVIIGATVAGGGPRSVRTARDNMALASTAISVATTVFTILIVLDVVQHPSTLPVLFPVISVAVVIVGLGAKVATFYIGNPEAQLQSTNDNAARVRQLSDKLEGKLRSGTRISDVSRGRAWAGIGLSGAISWALTGVSVLASIWISGHSVTIAGIPSLGFGTALLAAWDTLWVLNCGMVLLTQQPRFYRYGIAVCVSLFFVTFPLALVLYDAFTASAATGSPRQPLITVSAVASILSCGLLALLPWRTWIGTKSWFTFNTSVSRLAWGHLQGRIKAADKQVEAAALRVQEFADDTAGTTKGSKVAPEKAK